MQYASLAGRGWTHRNLALQYVRENYDQNRNAVLYFADDDNSYDVRLFNNYIRNVTRIGVWAVGKKEYFFWNMVTVNVELAVRAQLE